MIENNGVEFLLGLDMLKRFNVKRYNILVHNRPEKKRIEFQRWDDSDEILRRRINKEK